MTDIEAAEYLVQLKAYNVNSMLRTPANTGRDTFWDCALQHAIAALEYKAGVAGRVSYRRNPNGSWSSKIRPAPEGGDNT